MYVCIYKNRLVATHCNALQQTSTHCNILSLLVKQAQWLNPLKTLQQTATNCNTLQHNTTHHLCSWRQTQILNPRQTLQQTATHCNTPSLLVKPSPMATPSENTAKHCNRLQQTAIDCNRLQQTATDCNRLQQTATHHLYWCS